MASLAVVLRSNAICHEHTIQKCNLKKKNTVYEFNAWAAVPNYRTYYGCIINKEKIRIYTDIYTYIHKYTEKER